MCSSKPCSPCAPNESTASAPSALSVRFCGVAGSDTGAILERRLPAS
jgi:hypothetical protein